MAELSYSALLVGTLALVQMSHGCMRVEPTAPSSLATNPSTTGMSSPATYPTTTGMSSPATDPSTIGMSSPATNPSTTGMSSQSTNPSTTGMSSPATDPTSVPSTEGTSLMSTDQTADQTTSGDMTDATTTNATATPQPHCCDGKTGSTTAPTQWPATQSPAGGPAANPQAVVCIFYRQTNCLVCRHGLMISKCCTAIPDEKDDTKFGGPTPFNEYLIGLRNDSRGFDWYNLYPRKEAPLNGYYGYWQPTATGRNTMGLHPGSVTLGCVTVVDNCWMKTRKVLDKGSMTYNNSGYTGFLYVLP